MFGCMIIQCKTHVYTDKFLLIVLGRCESLSVSQQSVQTATSRLGLCLSSSLLGEFVTLGALLLQDVLVLGLTWIKTYRQWRDSRRANIFPSLSQCLLRDGAFNHSCPELCELRADSMCERNGLLHVCPCSYCLIWKRAFKTSIILESCSPSI